MTRHTPLLAAPGQQFGGKAGRLQSQEVIYRRRPTAGAGAGVAGVVVVVVVVALGRSGRRGRSKLRIGSGGTSHAMGFGVQRLQIQGLGHTVLVYGNPERKTTHYDMLSLPASRQRGFC